MIDPFSQFWDMIVGRQQGPLSFRLILQPVMAAIIAVRSGIKDARAGRPPYGWHVLTHPEARGEGMRSAWKDLSKLFILAIVLDVVYQVIVYSRVRPLAALLIALILAVPSYVLVRGPANRLARRFGKGPPADPQGPG